MHDSTEALASECPLPRKRDLLAVCGDLVHYRYSYLASSVLFYRSYPLFPDQKKAQNPSPLHPIDPNFYNCAHYLKSDSTPVYLPYHFWQPLSADQRFYPQAEDHFDSLPQ